MEPRKPKDSGTDELPSDAWMRARGALKHVRPDLSASELVQLARGGTYADADVDALIAYARAAEAELEDDGGHILAGTVDRLRAEHPRAAALLDGPAGREETT